MAERRVRAPVERGQSGLAVSVHALGVRAVERQAGEELGGHAAALARIEGATGCTRSRTLWFTQRREQRRISPHGREAPGVAHIAGQELAVDHEGAGVDVADRVDEADDAPCTAEVQAVEWLTQRGKMEEGVARQHPWALDQPVVQRALLRRR